MRFLSLLSAATLAVILAAPAYAADPESGTIDDGTNTLEWTGGPFTMANITPATGGLAGEAGMEMEPTCLEDGHTCDVFRFQVNVSKLNPDTDDLFITVQWPTPDFDYDVYLYDDETGERITEAATSADPEVIIIPARNGKFRLVVIPFATVEEPYNGRVAYESSDDDKSLFGFIGAFGPGTLGVLLLAGLFAARRTRFRIH